MTTFDERKNAFEKKFAHDADLKFKAESRRNKYVAEWAAGKLGIAAGPALDEYVKSVRKADLSAAGDNDVLDKLRADFKAKGVAMADAEIRKVMDEMLAKAVAEVEASKT